MTVLFVVAAVVVVALVFDFTNGFHDSANATAGSIATGALAGVAVGREGAEVRWGVARRMLYAWLLTLPAAGLVGGLAALLSGLGPPARSSCWSC